MARLLARRALYGAIIVWAVATITFGIMRAAPGDPVVAVLGDPRTPPEVRQHWIRELCLDGSIARQYGCYLRAALHGDFGYSLPQQRPVGAILADFLPNTLLLMATALLASFVIGIALGVHQARRRLAGRTSRTGVVALFLYSIPEFWLALVLQLLLASTLHLFPVTGICDPTLCPYLAPFERFSNVLWHLALPAGTLVVGLAAAIARFQRASMLDAISEDWVRTARAKGVAEGRVLARHVLRNALLPVITLLGVLLPLLLGGAVIVERIFAWPGMGYVTVNAIESRDYPLVMAAVLVASVLLVVGNLLSDVLYAAADPRVRTI